MSPIDELVRQWLRLAEGDMRLAELALSADPPISWGAAFHAQQAPEKLLKALLTHHRVEFRKTHNLDYLLELGVAVEPDVEAFRGAVAKLTDYAVELRYPPTAPMATASEALQAIKDVQGFRTFVEDRLR